MSDYEPVPPVPPAGSWSQGGPPEREQAPGLTGTAKESASNVAGTAGDRVSDVAGTATERASDVADTAKDRASDVVGTAKEEATVVIDEARTQVRDLYQQATSTLRDQAENQTSTVANALRELSEQGRALVEGRGEEAGQARDYARQAADKAGEIAERIETLGLDGVLDEVQRFARRRPGAFLAGAALAGVVVGRLVRNASSGGQDAQSRVTDMGGPSQSPGRATPLYPGDYPVTPQPLSGAGTGEFGVVVPGSGAPYGTGGSPAGETL